MWASAGRFHRGDKTYSPRRPANLAFSSESVHEWYHHLSLARVLAHTHRYIYMDNTSHLIQLHTHMRNASSLKNVLSKCFVMRLAVSRENYASMALAMRRPRKESEIETPALPRD
jgi:hypothetical protein